MSYNDQGIQTIERSNFPCVEYPDIYNFLVKCLSMYMGKSLKTYMYESLDAYNYYMNGWFDNITVPEVLRLIDMYVVLGW